MNRKRRRSSANSSSSLNDSCERRPHNSRKLENHRQNFSLLQVFTFIIQLFSSSYSSSLLSILLVFFVAVVGIFVVLG